MAEKASTNCFYINSSENDMNNLILNEKVMIFQIKLKIMWYYV